MAPPPRRRRSTRSPVRRDDGVVDRCRHSSVRRESRDGDRRRRRRSSSRRYEDDRHDAHRRRSRSGSRSPSRSLVRRDDGDRRRRRRSSVRRESGDGDRRSSSSTHTPVCSPEMISPKDTKPIFLYWVIASFMGRCEYLHLANDFIQCAEMMGFKICPPKFFWEYIDDSSRSSNQRVSSMADKIFNDCSPTFILCILDINSDIRESWEKHPKHGVSSQCISLRDRLSDTDRRDFLKSILRKIHFEEIAKAAEEHKRNIAEYRAFLESCDFIKVNSKWWKVQDRLEDDERCSRLEKIDRMEIFLEYIRDLEKEEEQQRLQKEQLRWAEHKNRDAFRKLMEEDVAAGLLTYKTHWLDYHMKVKDSQSYLAVASNTSGSTPKDIFLNVSEVLKKQYHDDKTQIMEAMKTEMFTLTSTWTYENFEDTVLGDDNMKGISKINLKLVFDDLMERLREKEAKKRQRLAANFTDLLHSLMEITASSRWDESKVDFEDSQEYKSIGDESFGKQIFEEYVAYLQEKAKKNERKREEEMVKKEKEREEREKKRREKEREREKGKGNEEEKEREREKDKGKERSKMYEDIENVDVVDSHGSKDRNRGKDKERKHRKHHQSSVDDGSSEKDEKKESKKFRRHSSDRKKSRKLHGYTTDSDREIWHKRHHSKDRDGSRRKGWR